MASVTPECTCYVSCLPKWDRLCIRHGAHSLSCPVYQPTQDPVYRQQDESLRQRHILEDYRPAARV